MVLCCACAPRNDVDGSGDEGGAKPRLLRVYMPKPSPGGSIYGGQSPSSFGKMPKPGTDGSIYEEEAKSQWL